MIAYNEEWLDHRRVQQALDLARQENRISGEEVDNCKRKFPVGFYTPDTIIRIGLFFLTLVIIVFSLAFFSMLLLSVSAVESQFGIFCLLAALSLYIALEFFVRRNHHYQSGVDDALLWMVVFFVLLGVNLLHAFSPLGNSLILLAISLPLSLRFVDSLMSALAFLSFLSCLYFGYHPAGAGEGVILTLIMMNLSALVYGLTRRFSNRRQCRHYLDCLTLLEIVSLISLYAAGNYHIARLTGKFLWHAEIPESQGIPFGWLFWVLTVLIPLFYLATGIIKRNAILLTIGLIIAVASVLNIRYYYPVLPVEMALVSGGLLLLVTAFVMIRYLTPPKYGFTSKDIPGQEFINILHLESLLIVGTVGRQDPPPVDSGNTQFGGGSGGGAGAEGEF